MKQKENISKREEVNINPISDKEDKIVKETIDNVAGEMIDIKEEIINSLLKQYKENIEKGLKAKSSDQKYIRRRLRKYGYYLSQNTEAKKEKETKDALDIILAA